MAIGVAQADVRVLLLGRTGLDAALRLDPEIELIRVRTPLEAIGELANPIDDLSPARSVVVVAPSGDGLPADASEFVAALRVASPSVVVLAVQNGSPLSKAYDAGVRPEAAPEHLRRAVRWRPGTSERPEAIIPLHESGAASPAAAAPRAPVTPESVLLPGLVAPAATPSLASPPAAPSTPPPSPPTTTTPVTTFTPAAPATRDAGDIPLVTALLKGQDPLPAAIALIRERTGDPSIEFLGPTDASAKDTRSVPVVWEAAHFGDLRAARAGAESLGQHARWLAGWLRLRDQQNQLRTAAFTDALTGAWNRRYFDRFISTAVDQARATRTYLTVLLFDIDNFKKYNDLYGHDAGDDILRESVRLLRSVIRPTDRVCRVGGDEFAVIFHEPQGPRQTGSSHPTDVLAIAGRFQQQILNHKFPKLLDCAPGTLTISGGLATFPWDGATPAELLAKADQLAMQSKRQGKNAITIGPGAMRLMEE